MQFVYLITNLSNSKVYVGKTSKDLGRRFAEHIGYAKHLPEKRLSQAILKYGAESFTIVLLESVEDSQASAVEQKFIAKYKSKDYKFGYNMTDGGEGRAGYEISAETIQKMSTAVRARVAAMSTEERVAMTASANSAKRGEKEKPSTKKSEAQRQIWDRMSDEERAERGRKSRAGRLAKIQTT